MSTLVFDDGRDIRPNKKTRRLFSATMVVGTLAPIVTLVLYFSLSDTRYTSFEIQLTVLIFIFARGHVGESILMYFDNSFQTVIKNHKYRFIYIPILLFLILPVVLSVNEGLFYFSLFVLLPWNLWHFGRQNIGVCALVSLAEGRPTPSRFEKNLLNATCALAILAHYPLAFANPLALGWLHTLLAQMADLAVFPFLAVIAVAITHMMINRERHNAVTASFFVLALTFFSMVFVARALDPGSVLAVTIGLSTAHAVQYTVIVYLMTSAACSAGDTIFRRQGDIRIGQKSFSFWRFVPGIAVTATILGWGIYRMLANVEMDAASGFASADLFTRWLVASATVLVYIHFIVDAGAFRLSEKPQREWVRTRLGFLFQK